MTTQTAVLAAPTGLTLTAKLFTLVAPDTTAFTADSVTERTNAKGQYVASFGEASAISGDHTLILFSGTRPVAIGYRTFAGTDAEVATETPPTVELDSASVTAIWNAPTTASYINESFGDRILISANNTRTVSVTGSNHVAADIHECQPAGLANSTQITAINTFATRVTTGLVADGPVWQFTANMLELAPSATGVDELIALQEEILASINGYISGLTAVAVESPGSITGFPETLRVGDSYTDVLGRGIQIPIVDVNGSPISAVGSKNFADATATFIIKRDKDTESTRIITGSATFVDPPGTGTSASETPYALIELPSSETAKGLVKYRYTGLLTFTWPYVGTGTDAEVMTFETGTITFEA